MGRKLDASHSLGSKGEKVLVITIRTPKATCSSIFDIESNKN